MGTNIAIVTGASSGIGAAFAKCLAKRDDIDELWLVARRMDRLDRLAAELAKPCRIICADLSAYENITRIDSLLQAENPRIIYLINAAGMGKIGTWQTIDPDANRAMIHLNCRAMVDLTTLAIPYMPRRSHIIEVVSCAAFTPLPHMNVYAASKAFMQSYTRGLRWELHGRGICATAVCPAWVQTEFGMIAKDSVGGADVRHLPLAQKPSTVARRSLIANRLHFAVATCGIPAFLLRIVGKFIPHCVTMLGWEGLRRL